MFIVSNQKEESINIQGVKSSTTLVPEIYIVCAISEEVDKLIVLTCSFQPPLKINIKRR